MNKIKTTFAALCAVMSISTATTQAEELLVGAGYPGTQNLHGFIATSTDGGKTWHEKWYSDVRGHNVNDLVYAKDKQTFVAVGRSGVITSTDNGETWEKKPLRTSDKKLKAVTYGNGLFVGVGLGSLIVTSTDGVTWKHILGSDKLINQGREQNYAIDTDKLKEWNSNVFGAAGKMHYHDVAHLGNGRFLVTGSYNRGLVLRQQGDTLVFESDFRNTPDNPAIQAKGIVVGADAIVILSKNKNFISRDGGATWKQSRKLKKNADLVSGIYTNGTYMISGHFGDTYVSNNAKKWEKINSGGRGTAYDIAYDGNQYYIADRGQDLRVSQDGKTWSTIKTALSDDAEEDYRMNFKVLEYVNR